MRETGERHPKFLKEVNARWILRSRPEHGRLCPAQGQRTEGHDHHASPRGNASPPTARSTPPTCAARRRSTPTPAGETARKRGSPTSPSTASATSKSAGSRNSCRRRANGDRHRHQFPAHRPVRLLVRADQPTPSPTSNGACAEIISPFQPIARSATSGWAGWAMLRSSAARPPTTAMSRPSSRNGWLMWTTRNLPTAQFTDVSPSPQGSRAEAPAAFRRGGDAGVIIPVTMYRTYGDTRILEKHLPAMKRWVDWDQANSTNLIRDHNRGNDYGDWLSQGEGHAEGPDRDGVFRLLGRPAGRGLRRRGGFRCAEVPPACQ